MASASKRDAPLGTGYSLPCGLRSGKPRRNRVVKLNLFLTDQTGVTGIEYPLIAEGISMGIVLVVSNIGPTLAAFFTSVESGISKGAEEVHRG